MNRAIPVPFTSMMVAWFSLLAVVVAACLFRGDAVVAGAVVVGLALLAAGVSGVRSPPMAARVLPFLALAGALIAAVRFAGDGLWPCPVSCQGAAHYQRIFGIPAHVPALAMLVAIALLAWLRREAWARALAWLAAGGSLFYLWTAWRLGLRCGYCFAVHGAVLSTALLALRGAPPWWLRPLALAAGAGALVAVFGVGLVVDGPEETPAPPPEVGAFFAQPAGPTATAPAVGAAAKLTVAALQRIGRDGAPLLAEVAVDLHCPHCAASFGPLLDALRPHLEAGRVAVELRFLTRRSDPTGRELAGRVLATASATEARLLVSLLLGTPEGRGWTVVRGRVAEILDPAAIERRAAEREAAIAAVLADDAARLRALGCRSTPFVVLTRAGSEVGRWSGETIDVAAVARQVAASAGSLP